MNRDPEEQQPGESDKQYNERRYQELIEDLAFGANLHAFVYLIEETEGKNEHESHVRHYLQGNNSQAGIEFMAKAIDFWVNFAQTQSEEYAELVESYKLHRQYTRDFIKAKNEGREAPQLPEKAQGVLKKVKDAVVPDLIAFANIPEVKERYLEAFRKTAKQAYEAFQAAVEVDIESGELYILKVWAANIASELKTPPKPSEN